MSSGEKLDTLDVFYPDRMAQRILGMGDITSLVEKAQEQYDEEESQETGKENKEEISLIFRDFIEQLQQIKRMCNLKDIMGCCLGWGRP